MPLAPPSSEMRSYAYSLMVSPPPRAISPSPMGLPKSTPTPVKLVMDSDSVLTGSPVDQSTAQTSPLGKGVDRILVEETLKGTANDGSEVVSGFKVWFVLPLLWALLVAAVPIFFAK